MQWMAGGASTSRTQLWLESLGDWAWPGRAAGADALPMPPAWVPALPPTLDSAAAIDARGDARRLARRLLLAALLGTLVLVSLLLAVGRSQWEQLVGVGRAPGSQAPAIAAGPSTTVPLPTLVPVSSDAAGSSIDRASYASPSLAGKGAFFVYLPAGFASTTRRYPVVYMLHGRNGHAEAFLEIGIQGTLDRLIAAHAIPPMIVVMIQDRPGLANWRNIGSRHSESYVVEVQELVDRMLPTIPARSARAIVGSSMGGFGAMHVALSNPYRFSVVESWLGFFNHLGGELRAARPVISRLGLHAFLYGAIEDPVAVPEEDPAFAAELRTAGATAEGVIYGGGHSLEKVRAHLEHGFVFAARSLSEAQQRAAVEEAARRTAARRSTRASA